MKNPFRRKKSIEELAQTQAAQQYYQTDKKQSTAMAWLISIVTLVITAGVVLLLFFGGRGIYRHLHKTKTTTLQPAPASNDASNTPDGTSNGTTGTSSTSTSVPNTPSTPTSTSSTTSTSSAASTTPAASANTNLPSTGPSDTLAIFVAVSVLAYVAHRRFIAE